MPHAAEAQSPDFLLSTFYWANTLPLFFNIDDNQYRWAKCGQEGRAGEVQYLASAEKGVTHVCLHPQICNFWGVYLVLADQQASRRRETLPRSHDLLVVGLHDIRSLDNQRHMRPGVDLQLGVTLENATYFIQQQHQVGSLTTFDDYPDHGCIRPPLRAK
ncbi:hypothetical protein CC80DRAFT_550240 [Byssothecium circinans]|uniref:Uncharacterized protein n=1 Tax=Byssothecium circinans TaxID=147558 RepID=A0A6A5U0A0_9PLEO|nr:hypothetical protein CC80DRAFT_550240 [Byssothecium circinans]